MYGTPGVVFTCCKSGSDSWSESEERSSSTDSIGGGISSAKDGRSGRGSSGSGASSPCSVSSSSFTGRTDGSNVETSSVLSVIMRNVSI